MEKFLTALEPLLKEIPDRDRRQIIEKYREHINLSISLGKTEEEVLAFLGNPKIIARYIVANYLIEKAEEDSTLKNIFKAVVGSISVSFFNLAFFLGPFLGLMGALSALFIAGLGISFVGLETLLGVFAYPALPTIIQLPPDLFAETLTKIGTLFLSLGLISFGMLFLVGNYVLVGIFYRGTLRHLRFHMANIKKGEF